MDTAEEILQGFIARPAWMRDALCREYPDVEFFVELGGDSEPAKAICRRCAVRDECATYAVEQNIKDGIWGGTSRRASRAAPAQLEWSGLALTIKQWSERLGIPRNRIENRLRSGWSIERALTEPPGDPTQRAQRAQRIEFDDQTLNLNEWSERLGITYDTLRARLNNYRWSVERALSEPLDTSQRRSHRDVQVHSSQQPRRRLVNAEARSDTRCLQRRSVATEPDVSRSSTVPLPPNRT